MSKSIVRYRHRRTEALSPGSYIKEAEIRGGLVPKLALKMEQRASQQSPTLLNNLKRGHKSINESGFSSKVDRLHLIVEYIDEGRVLYTL